MRSFQFFFISVYTLVRMRCSARVIVPSLESARSSLPSSFQTSSTDSASWLSLQDPLYYYVQMFHQTLVSFNQALFSLLGILHLAASSAHEARFSLETSSCFHLFPPGSDTCVSSRSTSTCIVAVSAISAPFRFCSHRIEDIRGCPRIRHSQRDNRGRLRKRVGGRNCSKKGDWKTIAKILRELHQIA